MYSATELLYSFRDTVESDFPKYKSSNAIRAFEKIREIKERVSSGNIVINK